MATKKTTAKKAEEVKVEVKAEAPAKKETAKKAPAKKETAKKAPAKKATTKKTAVKATVYVQYAGIEKSVEEIVEAAKAAATVAVKDVTVYVKPEDNAAYYVINGGEETGKVEL